MPEFNLIEFAECMRNDLKNLEDGARFGIEKLKEVKVGKSINGEVIAQATLALRHIEDARMRYGKVIQYNGDGESIYDKK